MNDKYLLSYLMSGLIEFGYIKKLSNGDYRICLDEERKEEFDYE